MRLLTAVSVVIVMTGIFSFATSEDLPLTINYATRQHWTYNVKYHSECIFTTGKSISTKKTNINCALNGSLNGKKDSLLLTVDNFNLHSDLYDSTVRARIRTDIKKTKCGFVLINGYPVFDTVADLSSSGLPEWNLYAQFAKLLPEIPQQPVKPGYTWERQAILPVNTTVGKAHCEVYRQFKVDRISPKKDMVYISWQFRYAPLGTIDSSTMTKYVPVAGSGNGSAVIDITAGCLVKAEVEFTTPVVSLDKTKINWVEKAVLELAKQAPRQ